MNEEFEDLLGKIDRAWFIVIRAYGQVEKSVDWPPDRTAVDCSRAELRAAKEAVADYVKNMKTQIFVLQALLKEKDIEISHLKSNLGRFDSFLETLSMWFYKQQGNPLPQWEDEFRSLCEMMEPKGGEE